MLVVFDFPYGYPAGLAKALDLKGTPWRAIWNELTTRIADDQVGGTNKIQSGPSATSRLRTS